LSRTFIVTLGLAALGGLASSAHAQLTLPTTPTGALVTGTIDEITIQDPNDVWSGGRMIVGGQVVVIPRNLILQLPANWLTLQQLFAEAPPAAAAIGKTGLAVADGIGPGAIATVHGNRSRFGNVIAGDVFIEKGVEAAQGVVTYIDYTDGYFRIDGNPGDPATGEMVRINDPESRHTIQQGLGCSGGPNCSPDPRFGLDPDNYTITFSTGYPMGLPSTVPAGQRPGFRAGDDPAAASDASGVGDPFAPQANRDFVPAFDSRLFAPLRIGDTISAEGNFEYFGDGQRFLSCHTLTVFNAIITLDDPNQPDYMTFDEIEWDVPAFDNQRLRMLLIGFTTLSPAEVDIFALHVDPSTNENNEFPIASTFNNPITVNQGLALGGADIFKIRYDVDFLGGRLDDRTSPCINLANAGLPSPCAQPLLNGTGTLLENFLTLVPISREIQARTRHSQRLNPGVETRDINGNTATNGQYLSPVGLGFQEFVEIDLAGLATPYSFDGLPWNLDRRLSPVGCDGNCESVAQPLTPFPTADRDPGLNAPGGGRTRIFQFFPFTLNSVLSWPPAAPASIPIVPTTIPPRLGAVQPSPLAGFGESVTAGNIPLTVAFSDQSQNAAAVLWDFGDGQFSIAANPVHTFTSAGVFTVTQTVFGNGSDSLVKAGLIAAANDPGGPNAPSASFTQDRTAGNAPLTVNFSDTSLGEVTGWLWNFGDGTTSNLQNPSHTYGAAGLYDVSLTVNGPGGSNSILSPDLISVTEPGSLVVDFVAIGATTGPAPLRVRLRAVNVQGIATSGVFDFGDGTTANVSTNNARVSHTYAAPGSYTVTLTGTDGTNVATVQKVDFVVVTP